MNTSTIHLGRIATARSGDKGNHANLGVVAFRASGYRYLCRVLTAERVQQWARPWHVERVERFELPGVGALNFLLYNALCGGASTSLRLDSQGKLLGTLALHLSLPAPDDLQSMLPETARS